jgi:hypothetical protein
MYSHSACAKHLRHLQLIQFSTLRAQLHGGPRSRDCYERHVSALCSTCCLGPYSYLLDSGCSSFDDPGVSESLDRSDYRQFESCLWASQSKTGFNHGLRIPNKSVKLAKFRCLKLRPIKRIARNVLARVPSPKAVLRPRGAATV